MIILYFHADIHCTSLVSLIAVQHCGRSSCLATYYCAESHRAELHRALVPFEAAGKVTRIAEVHPDTIWDDSAD